MATLSKTKRRELIKTITATRKLRSVKLSVEELAQLEALVSSYPTQERAAEGLSVKRGALMRILAIGSGSEESIEILRKHLNN